MAGTLNINHSVKLFHNLYVLVAVRVHAFDLTPRHI